MATAAALAGAEGRFLIEVDEPERNYIKLTRTIAGAGGGKRDCVVPLAEDPEDIETLCQLRIDFLDAIRNDQLRLNTGRLKYDFFLKCVRGQVRVDWDNARDGNPITDAGFTTSINALFSDYFLKIVLTRDLMIKMIKWHHEANAHIESISRMESSLC